MADRAQRDERRRALATAVAGYEAEHGEISADEVAAVRRATHHKLGSLAAVLTAARLPGIAIDQRAERRRHSTTSASGSGPKLLKRSRYGVASVDQSNAATCRRLRLPDSPR